MYYREQSFTRWLLMAFAALTLVACGGGGGSTVITGNTPAPISNAASTFNVSLVINSPSISSGSTTVVKATVTDGNGTPVAAGAIVQFAFGLVGSSFASLNTNSATTDGTGTATVILKGTAVGSGNVTATYTTAANAVITNSVPFAVVSGNSILVAAASSSVKSGAGGANTDVITAYVTDSLGGALPNQVVNFSVPDISSGTFKETSAQTTDTAGQAKVTFVPSATNRGNQVVVVTATTTTGSVKTAATVSVNVTGTTILLSAPQTNLNGGATSVLKATLTDGSGNTIAGQGVEFISGDATAKVLTDTSVTPAGAATADATVVTDANGQASITVTAPASAATVTVTAKAIGATATYTYSVSTTSFTVTPATGASLNVTDVCSEPLDGSGKSLATASSAPYGYPSACNNIPTGATDITVTELVAGVPKSGVVVYLSSTLGYFFNLNTAGTPGVYSPSPTATVTTDVNGKATIKLASRYAGTAIIQANTADGTQQTAVIDAFVAGTPTQISAQPGRSVMPTASQTLITATVRDKIGNPAQGQVVAFNKLADDSNGTLSAATATTDANGQASVTFTSGGVNGATDGVKIQASVQSVPTLSSVANLTVGAQAVNISIGATNLLTELDPVTYAEPFNVIVTNSSGQPVVNQQVVLKVYPVKYYKGFYVAIGGFWTPSQGVLVDPVTGNTVTDPVTHLSEFNPPIPCSNEDLNLNGILDPLEDNKLGKASNPEDYGVASYDVEDNNDKKLEPGSPATLSSGTVTTNANGEAIFNVIYARSYGSWLNLKLVATTQVSGSESTAYRVFDTSITVADATVSHGAPPGGVDSPYGTAAVCTNPN